MNLNSKISFFCLDDNNIIEYVADYDKREMEELLTRIKNKYSIQKNVKFKHVETRLGLGSIAYGYDDIIDAKLIGLESELPYKRRILFLGPVYGTVKAKVVNYPLIYKTLRSILETENFDLMQLLLWHDNNGILTVNGENLNPPYDKQIARKGKILNEFFHLLHFKINFYCNLDDIEKRIYMFQCSEIKDQIKIASGILKTAKVNSVCLEQLGVKNNLPPISTEVNDNNKCNAVKIR